MPTTKLRVIAKIIEAGLVVIVRADSPEQAERIAEACGFGGVAALEITFTVPGALDVISRLAKSPMSQDMVLGAGTVLDPETARAAILAGAQFIVSPSLNPETARLCNRYQIPYMPGAATMGEIIAAMECGADVVKIFPGELFGPAFVKAAKGPLPQASLMPTGGVSLKNVEEWIEAGSVAVGVGGSLTAGAKTGDYAAITTHTKEFIEKIRSARSRMAASKR
ncbi:MAG TPA: bifunctional 2-keto-4-hydroxyglutarate aldolase/2-keto-3-deoxy-6-phosphogluconate aldolase [Verrucomicrobiae bacterium]|nr:bifunctional 2-keto-4-hydroxyglutarate aldolase/2-keto-3-deoxy-6-phosphogluconate aldolase [Verrucomicrobiae bacterium]